MRLLIIAPINSIHTLRWVNSLANYINEITVASMHELSEELPENVIFYKLPFKAPFGYLFNVVSLQKVISKVSPDLIHTHFLSGYGTLSALVVDHKKKPHLLSMWGSDIYDFPKKSILHKFLIRWVANRATKLASTSYVMKEQFNKVFPKYQGEIEVTPFGVDTDLFIPNKIEEKTETSFNIGIAKNIEDKYGIKYLIKAFAKFHLEHENSILHIIGNGSKVYELKDLAEKLNVSDKVIFYGKLKNSFLPDYMNSWQVCVIPSILNSESFGVSAVEASSCGLPVIVSEVGGLIEVVEKNITGLIVPPKNSDAILESLIFIKRNPDVARKMGEMGRKKVLNQYNWTENVKQMYKIYQQMMI